MSGSERSQTFVVLLAGEPEAGVEVAQHVLVLARLPDVLDGVGQLFPPYLGQLLLLQRRQGHVGDGALRIWGGGLWKTQKHHFTACLAQNVLNHTPERLIQTETACPPQQLQRRMRCSQQLNANDASRSCTFPWKGTSFSPASPVVYG